ncbi:MAG: hypothetical protein Q9191_008429 [Dirinaria sp. TL-2023a]
MHASLFLPLLISFLPSTAAETVLGVYIFSRHGDRTSKSTPPTVLTPLGYSQIFASGTYYRNRYISSSASSQIASISPDVVKLGQISASAPLDNVLMPSAQGFLQGLYPPVGNTLGEEALRDGRNVSTPLDGYQLIPVQTVTSGTGSEDSAWLQGAGNCANAISSSNEYFSSPEYNQLLNSTGDFYKGLAPVVNATFGADQLTYKNAYTIFDLINVAEIHNSTIPSSNLLTNSTLSSLAALAATHEFALAYNVTDPIRAISGSVLAAQVVTALNSTIVTPTSKPKITIQFGAYGSFQSFFGLANLSTVPGTNGMFSAIPDYASSMAFELVTNATASSSPSTPVDPKDISVRFLFHNNTASNTSELRGDEPVRDRRARPVVPSVRQQHRCLRRFGFYRHYDQWCWDWEYKWRRRWWWG